MEKKFYIVHGYGADKNSNFFLWIKKQLSKFNIECESLNMPNSNSPVLEEWLWQLENKVQADEYTYFIGHSLGCITILKFIEKLNTKIGGAVLVSGFEENLGLFPQLNEFTSQPINHELLIENINSRIIVSSEDDDLVPIDYSRRLSKNIKANFYALNHYGHFLVSTCPELWQIIKNMLNL